MQFAKDNEKLKKIIVLLLTMLFVLTGCSVMNSIYSDDEKIASDTNTFALNEVKKQKIDMQKFSADVEFEGMDTIWKYQAEKDQEIEISYELSVRQGSAKLVLIQSDGTLIEIVEATKESDETQQYAILLSPHTSSVSLKEGENRIKLVAKDKALISFEIMIDKGNFFELGM